MQTTFYFFKHYLLLPATHLESLFPPQLFRPSREIAYKELSTTVPTFHVNVHYVKLILVYAINKNEILNLKPNPTHQWTSTRYTEYCCPAGTGDLLLPSEETVKVGSKVRLIDSELAFESAFKNGRKVFASFRVQFSIYMRLMLGKEFTVSQRPRAGFFGLKSVSELFRVTSYYPFSVIACVNCSTSDHEPIDNWDVSRVTDMERVFENVTWLNADLSWWDVSRVTNMQRMFYGASSFNQSLCGNAWVNSKASKAQMFYGSPGSISKIACGECPSK